jgi:hypothetical protein
MFFVCDMPSDPQASPSARLGTRPFRHDMEAQDWISADQCRCQELFWKPKRETGGLPPRRGAFSPGRRRRPCLRGFGLQVGRGALAFLGESP